MGFAGLGNVKFEMVVSEIRSLYRDENDLFRTVIKRIWEEWEFISEVWEYERKPVPETAYNHDSEVGILR